MTTLKDRITNDMKTAMKGQEKERLATIRLILAALKQKEVDERITLTDEQVSGILTKMIKQRKESVAQYEAGNRQDLADKETAEITIIQSYLPQQMSVADIEKAVIGTITATGATSPKDMGKVMAALKTQLAGKADMTIVSDKVKEKLAG